jgi:hypothetical protein
MSDLVSIDEFVGKGWYPGFKPEYLDGPFQIEPAGVFSEGDAKNFWFLDFHWPRGICPLGFCYVEDGYAGSTQLAAQSLPLPGGNGMTPHIAGTHIYASETTLPSPFEIAQRAERIGKTLPAFIEGFEALWAERVRELEAGLIHFEQYEFQDKSLPELGQLLLDARTHQKRAWDIHFEFMYPLLANYLGFYGMCSELGITPVETAKFLQGYDNKMLECDRALWELAVDARGTPAEAVLTSSAPDALFVAVKADAGCGTWLEGFEAMLTRHGMRTEGMADPMLAPWSEDPNPPLAAIRSFLENDSDFDFEEGNRNAVKARDEAVESARAKLTEAELQLFDGALDSCRRANFPWWNEDHNYYIDLRSTTPIRIAALGIGRALGLANPEDTLFCFHRELVMVANGELPWSEVETHIAPRLL